MKNYFEAGSTFVWQEECVRGPDGGQAGALQAAGGHNHLQPHRHPHRYDGGDDD